MNDVVLATICLIEKDGKYLMLHRTKKENDMHEGLWVGLGGKNEPGESPEECVVREVYEESGLTVKNPILRGIMTFPDAWASSSKTKTRRGSDFERPAPDDSGLNGKNWYVFLYTASDFSGETKECDEGELAWIEKDKIGDLPMHAGDYLFFKWVDECKGVFSAKFEYDNGKFIGHKVFVYGD